MSESVQHSLWQFSQQYISLYQQHYNQLPQIEFDEQWKSQCEQGDANTEGLVQWQPVIRDDNWSSLAMSNAVELTVNPAIEAFFGSQFSDHIPATFEGNKLFLLQAWNDDDFERLQENLISHILMKKQLKQPVTLFIAATEQDDLLISLDNETGQVVLEPVGKKATRVLANDLVSFIEQLEPDVGE